MDRKGYLGLFMISLFIGGIVIVITRSVPGFIGGTLLSFGFLLAIFSWLAYRKKSRERASGEHPEVAETVNVNEERTFERIEERPHDPLKRDRMIDAYISDFGINRDKAENLYDAGYSRWSDFTEAIPEDLLMVQGINPTVARRIISTVRQRT